MDHAHHEHHHAHQGQGHPPKNPQESLNKVAVSATIHCLTGCSIGEILGMVIGSALSWGNGQTVILSVILAFLFGYSFTLLPLFRTNMPFAAVLKLALASDTLSITTMEIVDNVVMLVIPGAMDAGLDSPRFWASLALALVLAGIAAFPVNRWLIARGGARTCASASRT